MNNCVCFHPVAPQVRCRRVEQPLCQKNFTINRTKYMEMGRMLQAIFLQLQVIACTCLWVLPSGRAAVQPRGFRVSGRWSLVSGCELAEWISLLCVVTTATGEPRTKEATEKVLTARRANWRAGKLCSLKVSVRFLTLLRKTRGFTDLRSKRATTILSNFTCAECAAS